MMQRNDIRARSMERALKRHPREEGNLEEKKQRPSSEPSFGAAKNFCVGGGSGKIYHIILYHRTEIGIENIDMEICTLTNNAHQSSSIKDT